MRKSILILGLMMITGLMSHAQLTAPPEGGNKKAMVGERIGITDVTIHYDRPGVNGREGKIWGQLIYAGYRDLGFGTSKASPWRAGANENTTIEFSTEVKIEGQALPAGKYGFFIAYDPNESTIIFSRNNTSWGSYFYDDKEDALRVKVKPIASDKSVERLKFEFSDQQPNAATVTLLWEKLAIPFKVEVDLDKLQFESFRRELRGERSFSPGWQSYYQAARYSLDKNMNLEEGLKWAELASDPVNVGEANFSTLSIKSELLHKLGRTAAADSAMKKAMPMATMQQLHQYGRTLLTQQKFTEALEVFKLNYKNHPGEFTSTMGLTRGYAGVKDFTNALKYAKLAEPLAPDANNKTSVATIIEKLKNRQDIN